MIPNTISTEEAQGAPKSVRDLDLDYPFRLAVQILLFLWLLVQQTPGLNLGSVTKMATLNGIHYL